jgi:hypothetical protein
MRRFARWLRWRLQKPSYADELARWLASDLRDPEE